MPHVCTGRGTTDIISGAGPGGGGVQVRLDKSIVPQVISGIFGVRNIRLCIIEQAM